MSTGRLFDLAALNWPRVPIRVSGWFFLVCTALILCTPTIMIGWILCRLWARRMEALRKLRLENQLAERVRITRDLTDALLQTIEASKMIADDALDPPVDPVRMERTMNRLSAWLRQATKEGQQALGSLPTTTPENPTASLCTLLGWVRKSHRGRQAKK